MSQPAGNGRGAEQALARLEGAVADLLDRLEVERLRAEAAEVKTAELARLVERFTGDEEEAGRIVGRLKTLEDENAELRTRLDRGREGVERMIARIRFLENQ